MCGVHYTDGAVDGLNLKCLPRISKKELNTFRTHKNHVFAIKKLLNTFSTINLFKYFSPPNFCYLFFNKKNIMLLKFEVILIVLLLHHCKIF